MKARPTVAAVTDDHPFCDSHGTATVGEEPAEELLESISHDRQSTGELRCCGMYTIGQIASVITATLIAGTGVTSAPVSGVPLTMRLSEGLLKAAKLQPNYLFTQCLRRLASASTKNAVSGY
jgi:hypothetical protein